VAQFDQLVHPSVQRGLGPGSAVRQPLAGGLQAEDKVIPGGWRVEQAVETQDLALVRRQSTRAFHGAGSGDLRIDGEP
jgi:hypothetical protein